MPVHVTRYHHHVAFNSKLTLVALAILASTSAFRSSAPSRRPQPTSAQRPKAGASRVSASATTAAESKAAAASALDPVVSDLRARISQAPQALEDNQVAQRHAEEVTFSSRFEIDGDGNVVGGEEQEARLARALARDAFVVVRAACPNIRASLASLRDSAEHLLGESRSVDEKMEAFGAMRDYEEGVVSGYAGGGDYGPDQFLETRGKGGEEIAPEIEAHIAPDVIEGRRALSTISCGVLKAVVRQSLPEVDGAYFMSLVDGGEGGAGTGKWGMSSTPLRMCRYAGADGVAFGAHTDTTFLTVIPCASAPGLEILNPSTGRWVRPEAAGDCEAGADVMLLAGELLQVLGQGGYQAAVHRVVRPAGLSDPRVSTPLLVRGSAGAVIRDSMLPTSVTACLAVEKKGEVGEMVEGGGGEGGQLLTMADLWAALQFRGGASESAEDWDDSERSRVCRGGGDRAEVYGEPPPPPPLVRCRKAGGEEEIRGVFEAFAGHGRVTVLSMDPLLVRINGFASAEECAAIMEQASGGLAESTTWGGADAQDDSNGLRSSSTTWIADASLPLLESLTARVSGMSGLPSTFMEKWQVARYKPQGYFKLHTDHVEAFNGLVCGGRLGTLILYLNDDFEGGQTDFPNVGITVQPRVGDAIYFHSVQVPVERADAESMVADERSAHAGLPVEGGVKWIATKWVHPLPYPNGRASAETFQEAGWETGEEKPSP